MAPIPMRMPLRPPFTSGLFLVLCAFAVAAIPALGVEPAEFGSYQTPVPHRVPYRAMRTPGPTGAHGLPLIVFLHGSGQDGDNNSAQLDGYGNGSLELVDAALKRQVALVFVAPQIDQEYWPPRTVDAVVADAMRRFPIDPRRVYLTGISSGATGVWDALKAQPACFAAGVPMSGMTELAGLAPIADVPQWIFHGAKDNDTNIETGYGGAMVGSRAVVRALRAMGGKPRYTEYANGMHVIWQRAYAEPGLLPWLLAQRLRGHGCDFQDR